MSLSCSVSDRLSRLRAMSESLCRREKANKSEVTSLRWVVDQLQLLSLMTESESTVKRDIKERINDILCVLEPAGEDDE